MARSDLFYSMENIGVKALIGRKIHSAKINNTKSFIILGTDKGILYLTWEGYCCTNCYLAHVNGIEFLIDSIVTSVENTEWTINSEKDYDVIESMGTTIKTNKGYVTFETRLEHNGYYSGNILVSDIEPMNTYSSPLFSTIDDLNEQISQMKVLKDF